MAFKDVINKLNLSGIGAKLKGLGQKLPFKRKNAAGPEELPGPDGGVIDVPASAQAPSEPLAPGEVATDAIASAESLPESATPGRGFGATVRGLGQQLGSGLSAGAAKLGGLFRKKGPQAGDGGAPDGAAGATEERTDPMLIPPGTPAFKRLMLVAQARAKDFATSFGAQASTLARQLKENFPKNMEDLKKIQPDELFERMRQLTGGRASGLYIRMGAALFGAYFLADTVSLFTDSMIPDAPPVPAPVVRRTDEKHRSVSEFDAITSRNIFSAKNIIPSDEGGGDGVPVKTNLPLNLIGTVVLKNEIKSIATIEDKSQNMVFPVRIGDTMNERIEITKIEHLKVIFRNRSNNRLEFVEIVEDVPQLRLETQSRNTGRGKGADGITQIDDTHVQLEQKIIKDGMANLNEVLQQARAIPNFENGMPDGYKILQIVPGSIFEKLGIKNGDVI
ncbi:MAG: hypothetical protein HY075_14260, partial [Deltaproteobacteria bacterium]|nr:hypothetical protein [Deltaproteobacteria bacterium]